MLSQDVCSKLKNLNQSFLALEGIKVAVRKISGQVEDVVYLHSVC